MLCIRGTAPHVATWSKIIAWMNRAHPHGPTLRKASSLNTPSAQGWTHWIHFLSVEMSATQGRRTFLASSGKRSSSQAGSETSQKF